MRASPTILGGDMTWANLDVRSIFGAETVASVFSFGCSGSNVTVAKTAFAIHGSMLSKMALILFCSALLC